MELKQLLQNALAIICLITIISACGDDDGNPPPVVDCNATGPSITLTASDANCGVDDGSIVMTVTGGTGNLTVTIDPQPIDFDFDVTNNTFSNMEPGSYTVAVTDADNCATNGNVVVDFVGDAVSYMADVDPIIMARCAITGCHVTGTAVPDFTDFATFQARANNEPGGVRQRVKTDNMPQSGDALTAEQKALLFCWIDQGALDN